MSLLTHDQWIDGHNKLNLCPTDDDINKYFIEISLKYEWFFVDKYGICFALKSSKELLLLSTYLISWCKDITFLLITKF